MPLPTWWPKHMKLESSGHCCFSGCTLQPCGCCVHEFMGHKYSCLESPTRQLADLMNPPKHMSPESPCRSNWPDAVAGTYDPRCCRFPKSCSVED